MRAIAARLRHAGGVVLRALPFSVWFMGQMARSNWQVARDLITPGLGTTPGVAAVPLRCRTRVEVAMLSSFITLTPGTLAIDVDRNERTLYVLDIYGPPTAAHLRTQIHHLETRMLRMLRGAANVPPAGGGRAES